MYKKTIAVVKDIVIDEKKDSDGKININKYPIFQYTVNGSKVSNRIFYIRLCCWTKGRNILQSK